MGIPAKNRALYYAFILISKCLLLENAYLDLLFWSLIGPVPNCPCVFFLTGIPKRDGILGSYLCYPPSYPCSEASC